MTFYRRKAYYFLIGFFCCATTVFGQDQKVADSLVNLYKADTAKGIAKLELLKNLSFNEVSNLKLALQYAGELIDLSKREGNDYYLSSGYLQKGNSKRLLGDMDEALDAFMKSSKAATKAGFVSGQESAFMAIADMYSITHNHNNAMLYYHKAIATLRQSKDSNLLAAAISNAGDEFVNNKNYDSALVYFEESEKISENINYPTGKGYSLGNIGMVYANIGQASLAEKNITAAIRILEKLEDYYPICVYLLTLSDIYSKKENTPVALSYATRSLTLAQQYGLKEQIADASLKLSELYEKAGYTGQALPYYKSYVLYRDSINNLASVQKMADLRTNYEVSRKQVEVNLLNQQKRNQKIVVVSLFVILILTIFILAILFRYYKAISREKKRSESLLLNILPGETAAELKQNGKVAAIKFNPVTVLFTDFVEFTRLAEQVEPEQLVKSIDFYFRQFDEITTRYGLEKIKTIGDSYMCACGIPAGNAAHATNAVGAAKEMVELVSKALHIDDGLSHFQIRIGIHTGAVVAGIVGIKKWQYDIWGDTVNIASRMEAMSKPGRINLSETTYHHLKDAFACEYRGEIEVKNHGALKMYFLL